MRFDKVHLIIVAVISGGDGPPAVLAWSTIPNTSSSSRRRLPQHQHPAYKSTPAAAAIPLRSEPFDDTYDSSDENDGAVVEQQRRRKRDILRRTLGLSTSSSDVKKLNTDKFLFSRQRTSDNDDIDNNNNNSPIVFRSPGQIQNPDLLTPDEISNVNSKYDALKRITEERTLLELLNDDNTDEGPRISSSGSNTVGGGGSSSSTTTISPEEARRIVDYTIDEERYTELRALDEIKKKELMQQWDMESISTVEKNVIVDVSDKDAVQRALQQDGVVREILQEEERQVNMEEDAMQQRQMLEVYERSVMAQVADEGEVGGGVEGQDVVFDDAYETAISRIQKSRKTKIGPRTLGILANSLALEEGKEYVRKSKREKEFLMEVERELELYFRETIDGSQGGDVVVGDMEVAAFFRPPMNLAEERMYRSIIRQIADKREGGEEDEQEQQLFEWSRW